MNRTKTIRHLLLSLSLAAGVFAAPAYAQLSFNISFAPPAPQYEVVPSVARGYVWAPGYWGWTGDRHVWIRGRSIVQREGYRWAPDRWDQRNSGYYRTAGHWEHDSGYNRYKANKENKGWNHDSRNRRGNDGHGDNGKRGRGERRGD